MSDFYTKLIKSFSEIMENEIIGIRRELHKIPELGRKEFKTSAFIKSKFDQYGLFYKEYYNTGIVGYINPEKVNKTILLRADIDALPQTEDTGLEFSSEHEGMMHACGHDFHMACLLGATKMLCALGENLDARIILVFQPDEEDEGGALPIIEEGIPGSIDACLALHIEPLEYTGTIQIKDGAIMASPDNFFLTVTGKGGHGACPEKCINPILVISEIISEYQKIPESIDEDCVVTVCNVSAGCNATNIIPDTAMLTGTARMLSESVRDMIESKLKYIADNICKKYNAQAQFNYQRLYPPLINSPKINEIVKNAAIKLGVNVEYLDKASMTGDDFSYFAKLAPSSYFKLGVGSKALGMYPLHSSKLNPDEKALKIGAELLTQIAVDFIREEI